MHTYLLTIIAEHCEPQSAYIEEGRIIEMAAGLFPDADRVRLTLKQLADAEYLTWISSWDREEAERGFVMRYALTEAGRRVLRGQLKLGRGVILDEPYTSALLGLGLQEGLIKSHLREPHRAFARELNSGMSLEVREAALINLVLFDDVVIPHDKAFEEYVDWGDFSQAAGLRVLQGLGIKERVRLESIGMWTDILERPTPGEISAWIPIVKAFLDHRGIAVDLTLIREYLEGMDYRDLFPILERGTQEEKVLFSPELVDHRINLYLKDRFNLTEPKNELEHTLRTKVEQLFWIFEAYFHLRYLQVLSTNPLNPAAVSTPLADIPQNDTLRIEREAEYVYSVFMDEIKTLPRPRTLQEAIHLRSTPEVAEFREIFDEWHRAFSQGRDEEARLRQRLREVNHAFRGLESWKEVAGWATYVGLPATALGIFVTHPVIIAGGLIVAVVGAASQGWVDLKERTHRWMLLGSKM